MMTALIATTLLLIALFVPAGCGKDQAQETDGESGTWSIKVDEQVGKDTNAPVPIGNKVINMCGRSVLGGWFYHWGWQGDQAAPAAFAGWNLYYHEVESPPGIVDDARRVIREAGPGGIVFFKLCFADFEGGDRQTAEANLARNKQIIDEVVQASRQQPGQVLLLGNALPVVQSSCDQWMVENQRAYNDYLESLTAMSSIRIAIVDLYGTLATPEGYLNPQYASDPYDSHPDEDGYDALDPVLRAVLATLP
jgi:hypothetical protein